MVEVGRGDGVYKGHTEQDKELRHASGSGTATGPVPEEDGAGRETRQEAEAPLRLGFKGVITLRRVRIKPEQKRKEYVRRLEGIVTLCEKALSDPEAVEGIQLKAANVIINAIRMSYAIVREVDIENLERQTKEIQRILEQRTG